MHGYNSLANQNRKAHFGNWIPINSVVHMMAYLFIFLYIFQHLTEDLNSIWQQIYCIITNFKGTCSRLVKFVYNFVLPQTLYISSIKPSLKWSTIFKLIVKGIELRAAFAEREDKQKIAKVY